MMTSYFTFILLDKPIHQTDSECQLVNIVFSVLPIKCVVQHYESRSLQNNLMYHLCMHFLSTRYICKEWSFRSDSSPFITVSY
jgi:hypothetical protein